MSPSARRVEQEHERPHRRESNGERPPHAPTPDDARETEAIQTQLSEVTTSVVVIATFGYPCASSPLRERRWDAERRAGESRETRSEPLVLRQH